MIKERRNDNAWIGGLSLGMKNNSSTALYSQYVFQIVQEERGPASAEKRGTRDIHYPCNGNKYQVSEDIGGGEEAGGLKQCHLRRKERQG